MRACHHGYNVQDKDTRPFFPVGVRSYKRYRADTGGFEGQWSGYSRHRVKLQRRQEEQRQLPCAVCGDKPEANGGYFVEERTVARFLWIPIWETIDETEGYCVDHEPPEFV